MPSYFVTVCGGFETVCEEEIAERLPGVRNMWHVYGRVFFDYDGPPSDVLKLRSVNRCYAYVAELKNVPPQRHALEQMREWIAGLSLDEAVALSLRARGVELCDVPSFRVTAQRGGEHEYRSPEIASYLGAGVVQRYGWPVDLEGYDIEVKAHLSDDWLVVGVSLTDYSLHRRDRLRSGHAALKASVAHCLIRIAAPQAGELLLDPMCGSGTIPIEAALSWENLRVVGGDVDPEALARAQDNVAYTQARVTLVRWDARRLPLPSATVDVIVSNFPWGRRSGSHRANRALYPPVLKEVARVLRPGGRAVVLTLEKRLTEGVVAQIDRLSIRSARGVSVSNLRPSVYELQKR